MALLGLRRADHPPVDDGRPRHCCDTGAVESGQAAFARAGLDPCRRRCRAGLRLVHHHGAALPRGPGLLRVRRGAVAHRRRRDPARRLDPAQHARAAGCRTATPASSACCCSSRRSASCAARRGPPGARGRGRARPRHRRDPVDARHGAAGGGPVSRAPACPPSTRPRRRGGTAPARAGCCCSAAMPAPRCSSPRARSASPAWPPTPGWVEAVRPRPGRLLHRRAPQPGPGADRGPVRGGARASSRRARSLLSRLVGDDVDAWRVRRPRVTALGAIGRRAPAARLREGCRDDPRDCATTAAGPAGRPRRARGSVGRGRPGRGRDAGRRGHAEGPPDRRAADPDRRCPTRFVARPQRRRPARRRLGWPSSGVRSTAPAGSGTGSSPIGSSPSALAARPAGRARPGRRGRGHRPR